MGTAVTTYGLFKSNADMDIPAIINQVFSGRIRFGGIQIAEVSEANELRFHLAQQGRLTPESDQLLQRVLTENLEISKRHAQVWLQQNPNPDELIEVWHLQQESMTCWQQFVASFERSKDIQAAYELAFQGFPSEWPEFRNTEARKVYGAMLKEEQQEFIGGNQRSTVRVLETDTLAIALEPIHARLLDLLMGGEPRKMSFLLLEVFGVKAKTEENKMRVVRRISELNDKLKGHWGNPPGKRWIERILCQGESGYQLMKGITT